MRPVVLELQGFGSFREPARVDFEDTDYFALVGPTGSGKSTIIDAITFALYGSVPRWNDLKAVGLALAPSVTRGTVKLVFDLGPDRYVVVRDLRRDAKGSVGTREARLERLADPHALAVPDDVTTSLASGRGVTAAVERLIGLSFENFTKCVVLPQGKFAEFMSAAPGERRDILVRLLGLDFYAEMMRRANRRADVLEAEVASCAEQLEKYDEITQSALDEARSRQAALESLSEGVTQHLRDFAAAQGEATISERHLADIRRELGLLAGVVRPAGIEQLAREHDAARSAAAESAAALRAAQQECADARALVEAGPNPEELRAVLVDRRRVADLAVDLRHARHHLVGTDEQVAAAEDAQRRAAEATESAFAKETALAAQLAELQPQLAERERAADALAQVRLPEDLLARLTAAQAAAEAAADTLARAEEALLHAERRDAAASLRHGLQAGDDCPVCRRPLSEAPPGGDAEQELSAARAARDRAGASAQQSRESAGDLAQQARSRLAVMRDGVVWLGAPAPAEDVVASWRELAAWAQRELVAANAELPELRSAVDEIASALASAQRLHAEAAATERTTAGRLRESLQAQTRAQERIAHITAEVDRLEGATAGHPGDDELSRLIGHVEELRRAEHAAFVRMEQAQQRATRDRETAEALDRDVQQARRGFSDTRGRVAELGAPDPDSDDLAVCWQTLAQWAAETTAERRRSQEELGAELQSLRNLVTGLSEAIVAGLRDHGLPVQEGDLPGWVPATVAAEQTRVTADVKSIAEALDAKKELTRRRAEKAQQQRVAATLGLELQSNRFQDWVIRSAFDLLVADASRTLLALSGDQFSLRLRGSEFAIVDHTDADMERPVKTLSGGETFQASLALALALSEHITAMAAGGGVRLESIILDEGFGTLDDASLDQVAVTLESLVGQGRTVGIVTHVRSLADRVPVRFQVRRDQHSSTVVREIG